MMRKYQPLRDVERRRLVLHVYTHAGPQVVLTFLRLHIVRSEN